MEKLLEISPLLNVIVTLLAGLVALVVYLLAKRNEKRSAATILLMDIRNAESIVVSILDKGLDYWTKEILVENNWNKYKHLFVRGFSNDEILAFNRFFDSCDEMSDARKRMRNLFYVTLETKAELMQQKIYDLDNPFSLEGQQKRAEIAAMINSEVDMFHANEPKDRFMKNLQLMGKLSYCSGFTKLKKIAGEKA
ncbi:hypothetical protein [Vibrio parahaemolyticus]|uniref:hypothetical protein n=1 Tax=Vibrio parahaemolyticus TaxID=670 RepID=UPI0011248C53|nr:hypothetical protein [Vibrio parahaemolyticus]MDS1787290.1 hypothetical protein [Vibrio parahaemolyticus]TOG86614.1 hypothetical protein CGI91_22825 [Vibrio parahaemolyticus]